MDIECWIWRRAYGLCLMFIGHFVMSDDYIDEKSKVLSSCSVEKVAVVGIGNCRNT